MGLKSLALSALFAASAVLYSNDSRAQGNNHFPQQDGPKVNVRFDQMVNGFGLQHFLPVENLTDKQGKLTDIGAKEIDGFVSKFEMVKSDTVKLKNGKDQVTELFSDGTNVLSTTIIGSPDGQGGFEGYYQAMLLTDGESQLDLKEMANTYYGLEDAMYNKKQQLDGGNLANKNVFMGLMGKIKDARREYTKDHPTRNITSTTYTM